MAIDTSGVVGLGEPHNTIWQDLTPFAQGYVEAALTDSPDCRILTPDQFEMRFWFPLGFSDLAPETLAAMLKDCATKAGGLDQERCDGVWFWKGRQNGHVRGFPPLRVTLGDDGLIYQREAK